MRSAVNHRHNTATMLLLAVAAVVLHSPGMAVERIHISGTEFRDESGERVWLNGINTAWIRWNDFGGGRFQAERWDEEFARYAGAGINCARVWIDCNGEVAVDFDRAGWVRGPSAGLFDDLRQLLDLANKHGIHVLAVLTSFDHLKSDHPRHPMWRGIFNRDEQLEAYTRHFVEPLARRFAGNPALLAWEICNEPEWIWVRHYGVSRDRVVAFHARVAAALHRAGAPAVTTGSASWAWHRDRRANENVRNNPWSDASLQRHCAEAGARLDFFQVHYYDWMAPFGWSPYARGASPGRFLRTVDRPVIVGETRGRYSWLTRTTVGQAYTRGAANGYAGVFGWSARGTDGHGNFAEIAAATQAMSAKSMVAAASRTPQRPMILAAAAPDAVAVEDRSPVRSGTDVIPESPEFERAALLPEVELVPASPAAESESLAGDETA